MFSLEGNSYSWGDFQHTVLYEESILFFVFQKLYPNLGTNVPNMGYFVTIRITEILFPLFTVSTTINPNTEIFKYKEI